MIQLCIAAFTMGILGSFHCVGMCGPLALSLPLSSNSRAAKLWGAFLYNSGRVVTYSCFGLLFGIIGQTAALFHFQQWLSIIAGVLILLFIVLPAKYTMQQKAVSASNIFFTNIRKKLGTLFSKKTKSSLFTIGLLNGLLPCGLVYMAIAGALAAGNIKSSVLFMAAFGIGTLPLMWSITFFGNYIGISARQKIRKAYPYMMAIMACLLIVRGMGLGIPYVSPVLNNSSHNVVECCNKP